MPETPRLLPVHARDRRLQHGRWQLFLRDREPGHPILDADGAELQDRAVLRRLLRVTGRGTLIMTGSFPPRKQSGAWGTRSLLFASSSLLYTTLSPVPLCRVREALRVRRCVSLFPVKVCPWIFPSVNRICVIFCVQADAVRSGGLVDQSVCGYQQPIYMQGFPTLQPCDSLRFAWLTLLPLACYIA